MNVHAPAYQILSVMISAVSIAVIHGSLRYGLKGVFVLFALCTLVGYSMENLSIATGFPFGHYHYTNLFHMPQIYRVPLDVGTLYFAMGYNAWVMAIILLDRADQRLHQRLNVIALPIVAAFIMAMWDVVLDPSSSSLNKTWIWRDSGGYFRVPFSNFCGWYFVVYLFFQAFALYLAARSKSGPLRTTGEGNAYWLPPILLYPLQGSGHGQDPDLLTNNTALPASAIAALYKSRWQVELFFKWIKQHLRIQRFLGTSENAVKTQIWCAIATYVLIAIVRKELDIKASLYNCLQILSVSIIEKIELSCALEGNHSHSNTQYNCKQLILFDI